ncbi:MAG: hypothetical protein AAB583_00645 [Patescibacteria group bacterium]
MFLAVLIVPVTATAESGETATSTSSLKEQMTDLKKERKNAISQIKDRAKEQIQEERDRFKERLQIIKDVRKKSLTQKLDIDIVAANAKHTKRFNEVLTKLQKMLDKVSPDAKDPKTLSDIKAAQAKIDLATAIVASQASKVYTIEITTETNLRKNVGTVISQFRKDLMQVHKAVVDAKKTVQALRKDKVMMKKEASESASL